MKTKIQFLITLFFISFLSFSQNVNVSLSANLTSADLDNTITYILTFDNATNGDVAYNNVVISSNSFLANFSLLSGDDNNDTILDIGETWVYETNLLVDQAIFNLNGVPNHDGTVYLNIDTTFTEAISGANFIQNLDWTTILNFPNPAAYDVFACGDSNFTGEFNHSDMENVVLNGLDPNVYHTTFYGSITDANNEANQLADPYFYYYQSSNTIYSRTVNSINNEVTIATIYLNIYEQPNANETILTECMVAGVAEFTLEDAIFDITDGQNSILTFHTDYSSAEYGTNEIVSPFTNTVNPQVIYARVLNDGTGCFAITSIALNVEDCTSSCFPVSSINVVNATDTSLDVYWTGNNGTNSTFTLEYGLSGFTPGNGTTITSQNATQMLDALAQSTAYDIYLQAICNNGLTSDWYGPETFTTTGPFMENLTCDTVFQDSNLAQNNNYDNDEHRISVIIPTTSGDMATATFTSFNVEQGYDSLMIYDGPDTTYPIIDSGSTYNRSTCPNGAWTGTSNFMPTTITATNTTGALTFEFISDNTVYKPGWEANITCAPLPTCLQPTGLELLSSNTDSTSIEVSWNDVNAVTPINGWEIQYGPIGFTLGAGTTVATTTNPFLVTNLQNATTYDFYVKANCGVNSGDDDSLWTGPKWLRTFDSCIEVSNLMEVSVTDNSATISWDEINVPQATSWEVEVVLAGTTPTGTGVSVITNPYTITGLQPETIYDVYVRVACGVGDYSVWSELLPFDTLPVSPTCGETFADTGGLAGNYSNNENETIVICPDVTGEVVTVQFTAFDVELNFDQLNIYDGDTANATLLGEFDGTALPPTFTSTSATGCLTFVFTSDESVNKPGWEANVICSPPPTCLAVSMLALDNVTEDIATISWLDTNNPQSVAWEYEIVLAGEPQTLNGIAISDNPLMITNLTAGTQYDIYIRSSCGAGDFSFWEMLSFTTAQGCMEVSNLSASAINEFSAVIDWNDANDVTPLQWEIEYGTAGFTQGNGTTIISQLPNIMLDILQANTAYDVYVKAVCSQSDFSSWTVINFITTIDTPLANVPYNVSVIPFQIYSQPLPDTMNMDDGYTDLIPLNFTFNYFGIDYENVAIGTNSVLSFNVADAGNYCDWSINANDAIPNASTIDNAILGAYQDYDNRGGMSGTQVYGFIGTTPFRKFVVAFDDVALYSNSCDGIRSTNQMIVYESYNYIDVQVKDRNVCDAWNGGNAIIGIQNIGGTEAYFPANRNVGNWEAHNEGHRFKPDYNVLDFQLIICDPEVDGVEVFNLNDVITHFDDGTTGITYSIHETKEDADNNVNPIAGNYTNTANSQRIFVRKDDTNVNEITIKNVLLAAIDCNADYDLDSVDTLAEDLNGNGNFGDDDTDNDGIPDFIDEDDDGDFVLTNVEAVATRDTTNFLDSDGDNIPNYLDNDDDGDGVLTINEDYDGDMNPGNDDTNNDGIMDYLQQSVALGLDVITMDSFTIYPNPTKNSLNIEFTELLNDVSVTIYSIQGQRVYEKTAVNENVTVDVSNFSTGVYLLNVTSNEITITKKFVKK